MSDYASRAMGIAGFGPESVAEVRAAQRGERRPIAPGNTDIPLLGRLLVLRAECLGAQMDVEALDACYAVIDEAMHTPPTEMQGVRLSDGEVRSLAQVAELAEVALRMSRPATPPPVITGPEIQIDTSHLQ